MSRKVSWQILSKTVTTKDWPSALCCHVQEAFFGKDLLDKSKQSRQQGVESGLLEEGQSQVERKHPATGFLDPSSDPMLSASTTSLSTRAAAGRTYTHQFPRIQDVVIQWFKAMHWTKYLLWLNNLKLLKLDKCSKGIGAGIGKAQWLSFFFLFWCISVPFIPHVSPPQLCLLRLLTLSIQE